jgi:hypothetical protein
MHGKVKNILTDRIAGIVEQLVGFELIGELAKRTKFVPIRYSWAAYAELSVLIRMAPAVQNRWFISPGTTQPEMSFRMPFPRSSALKPIKLRPLKSRTTGTTVLVASCNRRTPIRISSRV